ncbi:MAG: RidA family protein [Hyphomicrobiales bacterium]|nr:RidA family protein [Hyphomicrobiales bacterium]
MARQTISTGSAFEAEIGYARAVVAGDMMFVSGCTGYDYAAMILKDGVVAQCEQALDNVEAALQKGQFRMADVVRVTYYLPNRADFARCAPSLRARFGAIRPAATMLVTGLLDERMLIEIEVTARRV